MKVNKSKLLQTMLAVGIVSTLSLSAQAQQIFNPGFETNGGAGTTVFGAWSQFFPAGSGSKWYVQTGTNSPISIVFGPVPTEGNFAAMADQSDGAKGTAILYQDFFVPFNVTAATLSFDRWIENDAVDLNFDVQYFNASSLDFNTNDPNQQARFDIITTSADLLSTSNADVLFNLYSSQSGDPGSLGYDTLSGDITSVLQAHAGQFLRLRLAEVNNFCDDSGCYGLRFGADKVSLQVTAVPEPSMLIMLTGGISIGALIIRRKRRA